MEEQFERLSCDPPSQEPPVPGTVIDTSDGFDAYQSMQHSRHNEEARRVEEAHGQVSRARMANVLQEAPQAQPFVPIVIESAS